MSNDLEKFSQGATILQQVDVSDIFTSLALGIAEAQEKLDDNSIKQALKLADTSFGNSGKSLLELGFIPSFYSFTYADISANLNLKMALKESLSFGLNLNVSYAKTKGYDKEDATFIDSNKYDSLNGEYKSSKTIAFKANESKSISIEEKQFSIAQSSTVKSNIRAFKEEIIEQTSAEFILEDIKSKTITKNESKGVDVWMGGGYLRIEEAIHFNKTKIGLLKITSIPSSVVSSEFSISSAVNFDNKTTFKGTVQDANTANGSSGIVYGISKEGKFFKLAGTSFKEIPSNLYFKFNDDEVLNGVSLKNGSETALITSTENNGETEKNHADNFDIHKCLRFIHQFDPAVRFTITGQTDPVGGNSKKNKTLAKRRAESMRNHIFGESSKVNITFQSITSDSETSDLSKRKASIFLNANYIIFIDGNITESATPDTSSTAENKFVFLEVLTSPGNKSLDIEFGGVAISKTATTNFTEITDEVKKEQYKFKNESENSRNYFLNEESIVRLSMFTNESKEIKIDTEQNKSETSEEKSDSWISTENKNALNSTSNNSTEEKANSTFAISGSIDFRMSKQFEMSMEGNSSMSARLVAVPPPSAFLEELKPE
jgi:hypothetical protein